MDRASARQLFVGIAFSAAGVLVLEIGLTRIFSYTIWYHFAYLTISVALLGFGASGSFLTAFPRIGTARNALSWAAIAAQLGVFGSLLIAARLPLDPLAVASDAGQLGRLMAYYLTVAVPFFAGGLCVAGALQAIPRLVSRLYFWDLLGAGIGCASVVPLIWIAGTPLATSLSAVAFAVAAGAYAERPARARQSAIAGAIALAGLFVAGNLGFSPAPGKWLSVLLDSPAARIEYSSWNPINRVDVVGFEPEFRDGSYVKWGISPHYEGEGPAFSMIGNDGDSCAVMYEWDGNPESLEFLEHHVLHVPYLLLEEPRVVAIGLGGGADVLNALLNGARSVVGVEINPRTVEVGKRLFRDFNGDLLNHPRVQTVVSEGRSFLRTRDERYDLIEINSVDTLAALNSGAYVLSESYLYTSDAVNEYLDRLEPGGLFAMAVGDVRTATRPARHTLRLASVVRHALERRGLARPGEHVLVVGNPHPMTPLTHTLVKNEPFSEREIGVVARYVAAEGLEFWHRPDSVVPGSNVARILTATQEELERFYDRFPLRVRPVTDDSPFFFNFYKWTTLLDPRTLATLGPRRGSATGQIVLVVMLLQSLLLGALLTLLPLLRVGGRGGARPSRRVAQLAYFTALGAGFILLEISFIQRFVLFLGYPTYALTVVLFSLLVFSGLGSYLTRRIEGSFERALLPRLVLLLLIGVGYLFALPPLFDALLGWALALRILVAVALLAPLGLVLGAFFPLGIRIVERSDPALVPWAWAVNGCTTVVGTILAVMLAMAWSFTVVTLIALTAYGVGVLALVSVERPGAAAASG